MICFSQPRYPGEIQELLNKSGRATQQSQLLLKNKKSRLTKLIERGWIEKLSEKENQKIIQNFKDKRAKKRQYLYSTLEPIIEYIKTQIPLEKNEERQLKHIIEKESFRPLILWELGFHNFHTVKEFLFLLTFWTYVSDRYTAPYKNIDKNKSKQAKKKRHQDMTMQLMEKRNEIAERIFPKLKIELSKKSFEEVYSFVEESQNKLKPPLLDKLLKLSNNRILFFEMALSFLSCGEFMKEYQPKKKK